MIFHGPACFESVKAGFDLGPADTFYSHPEAYTMAWAEALQHITRRLVVTLASKGADKMVMYRIDSWINGAWIMGELQSTTQREFWEINEFIYI